MQNRKKGMIMGWTMVICGILALNLANYAYGRNIKQAPTIVQDAPKVESPAQEEKTQPAPRSESKKTIPATYQTLPSQEQKDAVEKVCIAAYEKYQSELISINVSRGTYLETCYNDILAIAYHESRFDSNAIGDGGNSHGAFQIYQKAHPDVSLEQATDFTWSATWTINHLHAYGYPKNRTYAIKAHNSLTGNGVYERDVKATAAVFLSMGL